MSEGAIRLVEDDGDLSDAVAHVLVDEGFLVARAANGSEALEALVRWDAFCAVLLDARMPVMNGFEFRRRQLRDPRMADVPVIAFSADPRDPASLPALGVDLFLPKPVRVLNLIAMVHGLCSRLREKELQPSA